MMTVQAAAAGPSVGGEGVSPRPAGQRLRLTVRAAAVGPGGGPGPAAEWPAHTAPLTQWRASR